MHPTRDEMIEELVEHEIEVNFSDMSYVRDLLWGGGFRGFADKTLEEIRDEWYQLQEAYT